MGNGNYTSEELKIYESNHNEFMKKHAIIRLRVTHDMTQEQLHFYLKAGDYDSRGEKTIEVIEDQQFNHDEKYVQATGKDCYEIDQVNYADFLEFLDPETGEWVGLKI